MLKKGLIVILALLLCAACCGAAAEELKPGDSGEAVLELNTRRLGDKLALKELVPIYHRYRELGGRFVTMGSDAHKPEVIGAHFYQARQLAADLGLQVVTFCKRQMEICD